MELTLGGYLMLGISWGIIFIGVVILVKKSFFE